LADSIDDLVTSLAAFDVTDLAAGVGALQLLPENADHLLRVERLAGIVASLPISPEHAPQMSAGHWRTILNAAPVADSFVVMNEDPFEEPYTGSISFYGGGYTVLPGLATGAVRIARRLTEAVFALAPAMDRDFANACGRLTRGVLVLSDRVAARAGLARATAPIASKDDVAVVPAGPRFTDLKGAVRWRWSDLDQMLGRDIAASLRDLAVAPGQLPAPRVDTSFDDQPAVLRPLLDLGEEVVVLLPTALLTALRQWTIVSAGERGLRDELARRYRQATNRTVERSLWVMGFHPIGPPASSEDAIVEHLWEFDDDKVAHVVVVTDPLTDYDAAGAFGRWSDDSLSSNVEDRLVKARDAIRSERGESVGVLHLVVLEGIGRSSFLGLTDASRGHRAHSLTVTSEDLEVMSRREAGDPLAIWKFARAADDLRERTRVFQWSTLDEYAIYLDHERSFYLGDDGRPTFLSIETASALQLRVDDAKGFDAHAVSHPLSRAVVHVQRRYEDTEVPIYATDPLGRSVDLVVELSDEERIWVISDDDLDERYAEFYFELKEAVAYWIWQIAITAGALVSQFAVGEAHSAVHVVLRGGEGWWDAGASDDQPWVAVEEAASGLVVTFGPSTHASLAGADNAGERELVELLIAAMRRLTGDVDPPDVSAIVSEVAPLGAKKKIVVLGGDNVALLPGDLPQARLVDDAEIAFRLDEMGEWLSARRAVGEIAANERVSVLNSVVGYYFGRLAEMVAELHPFGLLEFLVRHNESLVRDEAQRRLTLPTRIACFGLEDEARKDLTERLPKLLDRVCGGTTAVGCAAGKSGAI
jgi:hypothetical protein